MGLLNISWPLAINASGHTAHVRERECSKTPILSEVSVQQGRSRFDARRGLSIRERERREERQVCEPEGGQTATMSVRDEQAKPENTPGLSAVALRRLAFFFNIPNIEGLVPPNNLTFSFFTPNLYIPPQ